MRFSKLFTFTCLMAIATACRAQYPFFGVIPKPVIQRPLPSAVSARVSPFAARIAPATPLVAPKTIQVFHPIVNLPSYGEPGHSLLAGAGVAYQWLRYVDSVKRWEAKISLNLLFYGGGNIAPPNSALYAVGLSVGFWNNKLAPGGMYNLVTRKPGFTLGININFLN